MELTPDSFLKTFLDQQSKHDGEDLNLLGESDKALGFINALAAVASWERPLAERALLESYGKETGATGSELYDTLVETLIVEWPKIELTERHWLSHYEDMITDFESRRK